MSKSTRFIGLDESKGTIEVAVAEAGARGEIRARGSIPNASEALRKLVRRLGRHRDLNFVYEAGPTGYGTYRELRALGANCVVVAPSNTPTESWRSDREPSARRSEVGPASSRR